MLFDRDCAFCDGLGRVHSPLCNGDPDDDGVDCLVCDGTGVVTVDLNEEADDD